jgi:hypothetical protein
MLIYAGGSVIAAMAAGGIAWMGVGLGLERRRRRSGGVETLASEPEAAPPMRAETTVEEPAPATHRTTRQSNAVATQPLLLALIVAIAAAILVALLVQSQDSTRPR